jgi:hypothetical protein
MPAAARPRDPHHGRAARSRSCSPQRSSPNGLPAHAPQHPASKGSTLTPWWNTPRTGSSARDRHAAGQAICPADNRQGAKGDRSLVTFCGRGGGSFPVPRSARRFAVWAHSTGMGCGWQLELGCGRLCLYRWWVRGWEICRSYQNCASRRDSHGHGSQAAQPGLAQLILVFPSGVLSSTGRCVAMRRGRASVVACMSSLLPSGSGQACWSWFHLPGFKRLPPVRADLFFADSPPPPEALTVQT